MRKIIINICIGRLQIKDQWTIKDVIGKSVTDC